jgi:hypothetical protein
MPRVICGEPHATRGEAVNVRGFEFLLPVTTQIPIAKVIGKDEDDVGFANRFSGVKLGIKAGRKKPAESQEPWGRMFHEKALSSKGGN